MTLPTDLNCLVCGDNIPMPPELATALGTPALSVCLRKECVERIQYEMRTAMEAAIAEIHVRLTTERTQKLSGSN